MRQTCAAIAAKGPINLYENPPFSPLPKGRQGEEFTIRCAQNRVQGLKRKPEECSPEQRKKVA